MSDPIVPVVPVVEAPVVPQAAPVVPTAGPAPKAPVKADAPKVEPKVVPKEESTSDYTGNDALNAAISTFVSITGASDADMQRAIAKAVEFSNPALIDEAFIKERFGEHSQQALRLAKAAVKDVVDTTANTAKAAITTVHTAAGSEANWNKAVSVFNSSATDNIKSAVRALMNSGDIKGGAELLLSTVQGSGLLPNTNPALNGGGVTAGQTGALSAQQFQTEMNALRKEIGNQSLESGPNADKYNNLLARRRSGKQLGM